jgi:hypothetical protein
MNFSAVLSALAISFVLVFDALSPVKAQDDAALPIPDARIATATGALGKSPEWVHSHFGRPAFVSEETCCAFAGYQSMEFPRKSILVHAYDLESGGRLGFLYDRRIGSASWTVVGVVFDALDSPDRKTLAQYFPNRVPRGDRQFTCYDSDYYHHLDIAGSGLSTYALWTLPGGRAFYAKYLLEGKPPKRYDAISGKDVLVPIADLDSLPVVQWAVLQAPRNVTDLHIMPNNDDFSIVRQFKTCFR